MHVSSLRAAGSQSEKHWFCFLTLSVSVAPSLSFWLWSLLSLLRKLQLSLCLYSLSRFPSSPSALFLLSIVPVLSEIAILKKGRGSEPQWRSLSELPFATRKLRSCCALFLLIRNGTLSAKQILLSYSRNLIQIAARRYFRIQKLFTGYTALQMATFRNYYKAILFATCWTN